ncbi:protein-L-isoaspartate O-methyltransferase family protein [Nesterenkonia muleiensis]|uniref:protein-L-isoaspartate O-methyltransferase family protein n=1 Tax=Nesterenkonia muleiensis TaxID=2282648 RepID=UPI000E715AEE|nr:protein-L-isoaspartate O-methyltransferase [Nesterenkonia muleiensis]
MRRRSGPDAVAQTMGTVDRADFLPGELRALAGVDQALSIGYGQTNSQPRTVANMLRLLQVQAGHSVLDLGAGSGWTTALLGHLVGETGRVRGVELVPELAQRASTAVAAYGMPWAQVRQAQPGVLGAPKEAPFDRILVSAAAEQLPEELIDQLAEGGLMVIPVGAEMLRVERTSDGVVITRHGPYSFVPLR